MKCISPRLCQMALLSALVAGCSSYPLQMEDFKGEASSANVPSEYDVYSRSGGNKLLALQESGRFDQIQGRYQESSQAYAEAIAFCDKKEDEALVRGKEVLDSTLAVTYGNDLALDYPMVGFERMMLHVLDGFDRLALGDVDGFGVDMRNLERCRGMSQTILKQNMEALKKSGKLTEQSSLYDKSYKDFMDKIDKLAPGLQHSTDNIYALDLMALYREARGDYREALAHYQEIERIWPGNKVVSTGMNLCRGAKWPDGYGEAVVFFEEGVIPPKRTIHAKLGNVYMTLPNYAEADCLPYEDGGPLLLLEGGRLCAITSPYCDLAPLAVRAHEERLEGIIARKYLTAGMTSGMIYINYAFNGVIHSNPLVECVNLCCGFVTALTADIMVLASERPDLRSWLLLPRQVQMARFALRGGHHELTLRSAGKSQNLSVDVKPGAKTIIYCTSAAGMMKCFAANLPTVK